MDLLPRIFTLFRRRAGLHHHQRVHGHVFGGHDDGGHEGAGGHAEAGIDQDMPGISLLSPTVIASFVTAFGGFGMVLSKFEKTSSPLISAPLSALGGFVIAGLVVILFRAIFRHTQSSSESRVARWLGRRRRSSRRSRPTASAKSPTCKPARATRAPARDRARRSPVANGQTVKIMRIVGSQFYVVPI